MGGLSNLQFITICMVVMICGGAVLGHEAFEEGKDMAYEAIALAYRQAELKEQKNQQEYLRSTECY